MCFIPSDTWWIYGMESTTFSNHPFIIDHKERRLCVILASICLLTSVVKSVHVSVIGKLFVHANLNTTLIAWMHYIARGSLTLKSRFRNYFWSPSAFYLYTCNGRQIWSKSAFSIASPKRNEKWCVLQSCALLLLERFLRRVKCCACHSERRVFHPSITTVS